MKPTLMYKYHPLTQVGESLKDKSQSNFNYNTNSRAKLGSNNFINIDENNNKDDINTKTSLSNTNKTATSHKLLAILYNKGNYRRKLPYIVKAIKEQLYKRYYLVDNFYKNKLINDILNHKKNLFTHKYYEIVKYLDPSEYLEKFYTYTFIFIQMNKINEFYGVNFKFFPNYYPLFPEKNYIIKNLIQKQSLIMLYNRQNKEYKIREKHKEVHGFTETEHSFTEFFDSDICIEILQNDSNSISIEKNDRKTTNNNSIKYQTRSNILSAKISNNTNNENNMISIKENSNNIDSGVNSRKQTRNKSKIAELNNTSANRSWSSNQPTDNAIPERSELSHLNSHSNIITNSNSDNRKAGLFVNTNQNHNYDLLEAMQIYNTGYIELYKTHNQMKKEKKNNYLIDIEFEAFVSNIEKAVEDQIKQKDINKNQSVFVKSKMTKLNRATKIGLSHNNMNNNNMNSSNNNYVDDTTYNQFEIDTSKNVADKTMTESKYMLMYSNLNLPKQSNDMLSNINSNHNNNDKNANNIDDLKMNKLNSRRSHQRDTIFQEVFDYTNDDANNSNTKPYINNNEQMSSDRDRDRNKKKTAKNNYQSSKSILAYKHISSFMSKVYEHGRLKSSNYSTNEENKTSENNYIMSNTTKLINTINNITDNNKKGIIKGLSSNDVRYYNNSLNFFRDNSFTRVLSNSRNQSPYKPNYLTETNNISNSLKSHKSNKKSKNSKSNNRNKSNITNTKVLNDTSIVNAPLNPTLSSEDSIRKHTQDKLDIARDSIYQSSMSDNEEEEFENENHKSQEIPIQNSSQNSSQTENEYEENYNERNKEFSQINEESREDIYLKTDSGKATIRNYEHNNKLYKTNNLELHKNKSKNSLTGRTNKNVTDNLSSLNKQKSSRIVHFQSGTTKNNDNNVNLHSKLNNKFFFSNEKDIIRMSTQQINSNRSFKSNSNLSNSSRNYNENISNSQRKNTKSKLASSKTKLSDLQLTSKTEIKEEASSENKSKTGSNNNSRSAITKSNTNIPIIKDIKTPINQKAAVNWINNKRASHTNNLYKYQNSLVQLQSHFDRKKIRENIQKEIESSKQKTKSKFISEISKEVSNQLKDKNIKSNDIYNYNNINISIFNPNVTTKANPSNEEYVAEYKLKLMGVNNLNEYAKSFKVSSNNEIINKSESNMKKSIGNNNDIINQVDNQIFHFNSNENNSNSNSNSESINEYVSMDNSNSSLNNDVLKAYQEQKERFSITSLNEDEDFNKHNQEKLVHNSPFISLNNLITVNPSNKEQKENLVSSKFKSVNDDNNKTQFINTQTFSPSNNRNDTLCCGKKKDKTNNKLNGNNTNKETNTLSASDNSTIKSNIINNNIISINNDTLSRRLNEIKNYQNKRLDNIPELKELRKAPKYDNFKLFQNISVSKDLKTEEIKFSKNPDKYTKLLKGLLKSVQIKEAFMKLAKKYKLRTDDTDKAFIPMRLDNQGNYIKKINKTELKSYYTENNDNDIYAVLPGIELNKRKDFIKNTIFTQEKILDNNIDKKLSSCLVINNKKRDYMINHNNTVYVENTLENPLKFDLITFNSTGKINLSQTSNYFNEKKTENCNITSNSIQNNNHSIFINSDTACYDSSNLNFKIKSGAKFDIHDTKRSSISLKRKILNKKIPNKASYNALDEIIKNKENNIILNTHAFKPNSNGNTIYSNNRSINDSTLNENKIIKTSNDILFSNSNNIINISTEIHAYLNNVSNVKNKDKKSKFHNNSNNNNFSMKIEKICKPNNSSISNINNSNFHGKSVINNSKKKKASISLIKKELIEKKIKNANKDTKKLVHSGVNSIDYNLEVVNTENSSNIISNIKRNTNSKEGNKNNNNINSISRVFLDKNKNDFLFIIKSKKRKLKKFTN